MVGRYWKDSELRGAKPFRQAMLLLIARADLAYRRNSRVELEAIVTALEAAEPYASSEQMRAIYLHGFCIINLLVALAFADSGQHEEVYEIAAGVKQLLDDNDKYRKRHGLPRRDYSEIRYLMYNTLASAKWQGNDADRDTVMSPEELCEEWPKVYHRAMANANQRYGDDAARIADVHEALGWSGLQVIKCATRYCPHAVPRLIASFNQWYSPVLAMAEGNWKTKKPMAPHSVWFWDYELCKSFLASKLTKEALDELYARKEEARRQMPISADQDLTHYYVAIEHEYKFLKTGCKIEVVGKASRAS